MKLYMQDRLIAVGGLLLVAFGYHLADAYPEDSAFFPKINLIAIGFLLGLLLVETEVKRRRALAIGGDAQNVTKMRWMIFFVVTASLAAYAALVDVLGFYVSSTLFLLLASLGWGGVKKSTILLFTACFLAFLYVCFTLLFHVPLPMGIAR